MQYVTSRTGGTVVIGQHVFHAGRSTPFEKVPAEIRQRDGVLVTVSKEDPFALRAEGVVQPATKPGVPVSGAPGPAGGSEPPASDDTSGQEGEDPVGEDGSDATGATDPSEDGDGESGGEPAPVDPFADDGDGAGQAPAPAAKPVKKGKGGMGSK